MFYISVNPRPRVFHLCNPHDLLTYWPTFRVSTFVNPTFVRGINMWASFECFHVCIYVLSSIIYVNKSIIVLHTGLRVSSVLVSTVILYYTGIKPTLWLIEVTYLIVCRGLLVYCAGSQKARKTYGSTTQYTFLVTLIGSSPWLVFIYIHICLY